MQKSVISAISERESGDGSAGIFQGFKVEIRIFSSILQPVLKFFDRRSAFLGLGCALLLSGCGSVMQAQQEAMDHYRAIILEEAQLDNSTREQLYQQEGWYQEKIWQKREKGGKIDGKDASLSPEASALRTRDFVECLESANAIEAGISERMGGRDPIQIVHGRATVEVCMVTRGYHLIPPHRSLICETDQYDVLPVCHFARREILNYRDQWR